jgi:hypothetical protein
MAEPPSGTVTFLFTDIEGSTKLWERDATAMRSALVRHDEILRSAIEESGGHLFKTVGDAFCAAFSSAPEALGAALSAQRALHAEEWDEACVIRARMALHTGTVDERGDYFGPALRTRAQPGRQAPVRGARWPDPALACNPGAGEGRAAGGREAGRPRRETPQGSLPSRASVPDHRRGPSFGVPALEDAREPAQQPPAPTHAARLARAGGGGGSRAAQARGDTPAHRAGRAWEEWRAMTLEDAIAYALEDTEEQDQPGTG